MLRLCFLFFFVSGFCGLLYQTVWTRLAFAAFGVITPVLSVVVSVFMLGLALGSWLAGKYATKLRNKTGVSPMTMYGIVEAIIGIGAIAVPELFAVARSSLLSVGSFDSLTYLVSSGVALSLILLPWCVAMGATYPLVMTFLKERFEDKTSFSYLYVANCFGAMIGTVITAFVLIELLGFRSTLLAGALANFAIAGTAISIGSGQSKIATHDAAVSEDAPTSWSLEKTAIAILFWTGFASMAMEVVWVRAFLYAIGHEVYAFAQLLAVYLLATCIGSVAYRRVAGKTQTPLGNVVLLLGGTCLFPLLLNDFAFRSSMTLTLIDLFNLLHIAHPSGEAMLPGISAVIALISIAPCSAIFGYLTPRVIDEYGKGSAASAGRLYAINTLGCIAGPLVASYLLLPAMGVKAALLLLSLPFMVPLVGMWPLKERRQKMMAAAMICTYMLTIPAVPYEELPLRHFNNCEIRRDYAATVVAFGEGFKRNLLVNGCPVTSLDQCTKNIAHFPLVALSNKPESALVICFGMGTTFRSLLTWGIDVTAVELVPSVVKSFPFFYPEAEQLLAIPRSHVVIDDGRRYLQRSDKKYDMVTIDPSPVMAKGYMSLIMSPEFFQLVKHRLRPGGIFELFMGYADLRSVQAVARGLSDSYKYVRMFEAPGAGVYTLASDDPIVVPENSEAMLSKMPEAAIKDLAEWSKEPPRDAGKKHFDLILAYEIDVEKFLNPDRTIRVSDDHPYNEYFFVRNAVNKASGAPAVTIPYKTRKSVLLPQVAPP